MRTNYPKLIFELDKEMDYWTAGEFLTLKEDEDGFSRAILAAHPDLSVLKDKPKNEWPEIIKSYVDACYQAHVDDISKAKVKVQQDWDVISEEFYKAVDNLFEGHPWPEGAYVGFLSIFDSNPRFLDSKTFQAYYQHSTGLKYITCHEMLHFMFFDYATKYFPKFTEDDLWLTSELFNDVILALPEFVVVTGNKTPQAYPSHVKLVPEAKALWAKSPIVKNFITSGVKLFKVSGNPWVASTKKNFRTAKRLLYN